MSINFYFDYARNQEIYIKHFRKPERKITDAVVDKKWSASGAARNWKTLGERYFRSIETHIEIKHN
ncbi:hypothetical protein DSM107007_27690 [Nostoc sp. PCC 7120 = FACHB-418]|nr:hypothetical protein DSM107007_27690 [Nostoc sp. PCC 7120 = FACHB-418]